MSNAKTIAKLLDEFKPSASWTATLPRLKELLGNYHIITSRPSTKIDVEYVECPSCGGKHCSTCHQCKGVGVVPRRLGNLL